MKKVTLTEKQKKILKTTAVVTGGVICVVVGAKVISRTELGSSLKSNVIHRMLRSKQALNRCDFQMHTYVSNRACPDGKVAEKAFDEAYKLWKSIILEAKDAG